MKSAMEAMEDRNIDNIANETSIEKSWFDLPPYSITDKKERLQEIKKEKIEAHEKAKLTEKKTTNNKKRQDKTIDKSTYSEKLKHPKWQKKRLEVFNRDSWKCQLCGSEDKTLNVHHKSYKYGNEPWEYDDDNFVTVCEICHESIEYIKKNFSVEYDEILDIHVITKGEIKAYWIATTKGVFNYYLNNYGEIKIQDYIQIKSVESTAAIYSIMGVYLDYLENINKCPF